MSFDNKLNQVLNELFEVSSNITWKAKGKDRWHGEFVVEGNKYQIFIVRDEISPTFFMPWEIIFCLESNGKCVHDITGTGNASQVFATVLEGIKQWVKETEPTSFMMSAAEKSRSSLYKKMLSKMLPKDFKVEVHPFSDSSQTTFEVSREHIPGAVDAWGYSNSSASNDYSWADEFPLLTSDDY